MEDDTPTLAFPGTVMRWFISVSLVACIFVSPLNEGLGNSMTLAKAPEQIVKTPPIAIQKEKAPPKLVKQSIRKSGKEADYFFDRIIIQVSQRHQVDPALVKAIIMAESGYNPNAVSKKGAMGLMQLMPNTAKALGVKDSFNPEHNIEGGVRYFKKLVKKFDGNIELALAAYNAGSRKVREYQGVPPFKATRGYVKKVFKYYRYYRDEMNDPTGNA